MGTPPREMKMFTEADINDWIVQQDSALATLPRSTALLLHDADLYASECARARYANHDRLEFQARRQLNLINHKLHELSKEN